MAGIPQPAGCDLQEAGQAHAHGRHDNAATRPVSQWSMWRRPEPAALGKSQLLPPTTTRSPIPAGAVVDSSGEK